MIAGTGAEHHRFAPVLALFGLVKTAAKQRRESEGEAPSVGVGDNVPKRVWAAPNVFPRFANLPYIKKSAPTRCRD